MKKYILIAIVLLKTISLIAQTSRFEEDETLNVWATSGLNMRDKPDAEALKIAAIPYGAKVLVQPNMYIKIPFEIEEFKGFIVKGYWLLVKYGDIVGFVFDGFLSRLPAPIPTEQDLAIETYLYQQIGEVGKKYAIQIFDKASGKYRMMATNETIKEKDVTGFSQKYKYDIVYESKRREGGGGVIIELLKLSLYEVYFLVKTYIYDTKTDVFIFNKKDKSIKMKPKEEAAGCYYTIKQQGNKIIIDRYSGR